MFQVRTRIDDYLAVALSRPRASVPTFSSTSATTTTVDLNTDDNDMAIAPITGRLRKRFWLDLTCALGTGVAAGYAYW